MKLETAKKVFKDRAENFYGRSVAWLADEMQKGFNEVGYADETQRVTQAYNVLKKADLFQKKVDISIQCAMFNSKLFLRSERHEKV